MSVDQDDWFSLTSEELAEIRAAVPQGLDGVEAFNPDLSAPELFTEDDPVPWSAEQPTEHEAQLHLAMLDSCLDYFASEMLSGPPEFPYEGRFLISEHHEQWAELVTRHRRLCILAPRDHGKSHFFTFAYPIWMAWRYPNKTGFVFSATQQQAKDILERIKDEIEVNPKLHHLLPTGKAARWSANEIKLANGHRILARGMGTKVRGAHPMWVILDDALNDETAYSELVRTKQIDYFRKAITPMVHTTGTIIVVGTPFHSSDLYGVLKDNEIYEYVKFQAWDAGTKQALWPERFNEDALNIRLKEIGSVAFARELMCDPVSDDTSLFPEWLFHQPDVMQPHMRLGMPLSFWKQFDIEIFMGVDFAISTNVSADETVIWVMGVDRWGVRWIIDIFCERGMPYRAQKAKIMDYWRRYDPSMVFLESNQMQRIFSDDLIIDTDMPITKFVTKGEEKHDLVRGLPSLRILLENRKFRIPAAKDERTQALIAKWIDQMRYWTFDKGKLVHVGDHDDMSMACWITDQAIRAGGGAVGAVGFPTSEEVAKQQQERLSLDEMLRRQAAEATATLPDDATGPSPFDLMQKLLDQDEVTPDQLQQVLDGEVGVPADVRDLISEFEIPEELDLTPEAYHAQPASEPPATEVDPFTGRPIDDDWRKSGGAPAPNALRVRF